MIIYLAYIIGQEKNGKYFTTPREAFDYVNSLTVPNHECEIVPVEIPDLEIPV